MGVLYGLEWEIPALMQYTSPLAVPSMFYRVRASTWGQILIQPPGPSNESRKPFTALSTLVGPRYEICSSYKSIIKY